ncbi:cyclin-like protein [Podospora fimiseda]|uniref:RNA polymerase II holoenzyme cyclin-like subunit n=1 Tax=Podospora fimiseda TaxID=252190 RepID=A0AAN7H3K6_9PEZI|nr:cyclin-like protein [Podospora fimiseda]
MSSNIDRYRPGREPYQPPSSLPSKPPTSVAERLSKSPSRRRDVPPAVPSPPTHTSRTSPPRPNSRRSAQSPAQSSSPRTHQPRREQWLFTQAEVASTPSIIDGLSIAEEKLRRAKGINFIKQAAVILNLPVVTIWVASVFFHRFYMRYSLDIEKPSGVHHYNIAATALFLAGKTEENCRKTKDVIIAVAKVAQKDTSLELDEQSKEYWRWRDNILMYEELMLEALTFDLTVENPLNHLRDQFKTLRINHNTEKDISNSACAFCNDACLTVLPLLLSAKDVASGAIFFALTVNERSIEDINGRPWWEAVNASEENIALAVNTVCDFYRENPMRKRDPNVPASPKFNLGGTRRPAGGSQNGTPTPTSPKPKVNGRSMTGSSSNYHTQEGNNKDIVVVVKQEDDGERDRGEVQGIALHPSVEDQQGRGDSDAALKAAANDLSLHDNDRDQRTDENGGGGLVSPPRFSKRKSAELDVEEGEEREAKKPKLEQEDGDEGEIKVS